MGKRSTVLHWQEEFALPEFCRRLGIPEGDAPDVFMVYAGPVGVSVRFVHRVDGSKSVQWSCNWWFARRFCRALGLPASWGSHLVSSGPDALRHTITLRFVS